MSQKVKSNYKQFRDEMLIAIDRVIKDIDILYNASEKLYTPRERSAVLVLWNVVQSHLEDIEQDLKEGVALGSHTYTYGYDIERVMKNAKERK